MSTAPPTVARFNEWGHWAPLLIHSADPHARDVVARAENAVPSAAGRAVAKYCAMTGYEGIEFVVVSSGIDRRPFRLLQDGIVLVPCYPRGLPGSTREGAGPIFGYEMIYDGWMPLNSTDPQEVLRGLSRVEEAVAMMGYTFNTRTRWFPKYVETMGGRATTEVSDSDGEHLNSVVGTVATLPPPVRASLVGSIHWFQYGVASRSLLDRFTALYFALEGLSLSLWENASSIQLPVLEAEPTLSKSQRRRVNSEKIRELLREGNNDLGAAVQRAYFDVVVNIRKRQEGALRAVFGTESDAPSWLYSKGSSGLSPAQLRSEIAHGRVTGVDVHQIEVLASYCARLEGIVSDLIARVAARCWCGAEMPRPPARMFTMTFLAADMAGWVSGSGTATFSGDTRITPSLLAAKGLLW